LTREHRADLIVSDDILRAVASFAAWRPGLERFGESAEVTIRGRRRPLTVWIARTPPVGF
jgi:hypothetical protein